MVYSRMYDEERRTDGRRQGNRDLFSYLTICNGINIGLKSAYRGMYHSKLDLEVFQETKVTDGIHTCNCYRFGVKGKISNRCPGKFDEEIPDHFEKPTNCSPPTLSV